MNIYIIEFLDTDYFYIGSTKNYIQRQCNHIGQLKRGVHPNSKLQNLFNMYPDKYIMRIIDEAKNVEELLELEQKYIDTFNPSLNIRSTVYEPKGGDASRLYELINVYGVIVKTNNVTEFCKQHDIQRTSFYKLSLGQRVSCKGWKILSIDGIKIKQKLYKGGIKPKRYLITTPTKLQFCVIGLNHYCEKEGLNIGSLSRVARGISNHHKGYLCEEII